MIDYRECAKCRRWYDKKNRIYIPSQEEREKAIRNISHGYCLDCYDKIMKELEDDKPQTTRKEKPGFWETL
jgi:hypothetical protein